uniref:hypothetical protein n=1 Tax=Nitrosomonas europaea TaxID=915 RepID=UPI002492FEF6
MSELNPNLLATLGELADELVEQTGPTDNFVYVDISSIDRETKKITDPKPLTLSQAPSRAKQLLRAGDVLVSMTRPNLNAVALVPEQLDGAIGSTGFHVLRSRWLNPDFLLALVQTQNFIDAMSAVVQGALYPAVRPRDISAYSFPFETPAQQNRIVEKLEELLSDLDAGVVELKVAQKKLGQYRQSLLKAAVEGALTADWREAQRKHTTLRETGAQLLQRILTERRARWEAKQLAKFAEQGKIPPKDWQKKYPEPARLDTSGLPELPEGWVWASLEQLLSQLRSGTAETSGRDATFYPVLKSSAVRQGAIDFSAVNFLQESQCHTDNFLEVGDLLITRLSGSVEYVGCAAVVAEHAATSIQYPDRIFCGKLAFQSTALSAHIVTCLSGPVARQRIEAAAKSTAGHKRIALSDLLPFPIPLPATAEISEIKKLVETGLQQLKSLHKNVDFSCKQSAAQRKNILKAAFSGQLVPQDPNDEPASVLL